MYAAEYEIELYGLMEEDMYSVQSALVEGAIQGDDRDGIGMYLRDGKPDSVFVNPSDVSKAVEIINGLGYGTDEDEESVED